MQAQIALRALPLVLLLANRLLVDGLGDVLEVGPGVGEAGKVVPLVVVQAVGLEKGLHPATDLRCATGGKKKRMRRESAVEAGKGNG